MPNHGPRRVSASAVSVKSLRRWPVEVIQTHLYAPNGATNETYRLVDRDRQVVQEIPAENTILQVTDVLSTRRFAVRIEAGHDALPLGELLDRYLKGPALQRLLAESRITEESAETLASVQDLVYVASDDGRLHGMFAGVEFGQGPRVLALDQVPRGEPLRVGDKEGRLIDIQIDRTSVGYDRNWVGFNRRRWDRHPDLYESFVRRSVEQELGRAEAQAVLALDTTEHRLSLVKALARRIWESDFESYSRFIGRRLAYKSGDETVRNVIEGSGGICSEKVQALKFLTDHYGLSSEYILAGPNTPGPVPETRLRELLATFDFSFAKRYMRYWQHTALLYTVDGVSALVDDTNGNIPFMFLRDAEAEQVLGYGSKRPIRVRMAVSEEDFHYHRVSQDIAEHLFFAMEGWVPFIDLVQVFENELGLCITRDFMVTAAVYKSAPGLERLRREYLKACGEAGLECSVADGWELDSPLGRRFAASAPEAAQKVLEARDHLLARYDDCSGAGHEAGLVVIGLRR